MQLDDPPGSVVLLLPWHTGPEMLAAVRAAREAAAEPDRLTVVGYGAAGVAALSLALHQRRLGIGVVRAVCIGAAGELDPVSGQPLSPPTPPAAALRGITAIDVVPGPDAASADWSRATAAAWRAAGWPVADR